MGVWKENFQTQQFSSSITIYFIVSFSVINDYCSAFEFIKNKFQNKNSDFVFIQF